MHHKYVFMVVRKVTNELKALDMAAVKNVRERLLLSHSEKLETRHLAELPAGARSGACVDRGQHARHAGVPVGQRS